MFGFLGLLSKTLCRGSQCRIRTLRWGPGLPKDVCRPFGPQFGPKIRGPRAPPLDPLQRIYFLFYCYGLLHDHELQLTSFSCYFHFTYLFDVTSFIKWMILITSSHEWKAVFHHISVVPAALSKTGGLFWVLVLRSPCGWNWRNQWPAGTWLLLGKIQWNSFETSGFFLLRFGNLVSLFKKPLLERLSITFTSNGKREFVPCA